MPLLDFEDSAVNHLGDDALAFDAHYLELEVAVVEQDAVAGSDVPRQGVVGGGDEVARALDGFVGGDGEGRPVAELDRVVLDPARADLGPGEVLQERYGAAGALRDVPDGIHDQEVVGVLAVREVHPHHVHAGLDELLQGAGVARRRADGGHDLGAPHAREYSRPP